MTKLRRVGEDVCRFLETTRADIPSNVGREILPVSAALIGCLKPIVQFQLPRSIQSKIMTSKIIPDRVGQDRSILDAE